MIYCDKAFAKVNLHLEVLNKRLDGYHEIASLMATVGIHDLLKLDESDCSKSTDPHLEMRIATDGGVCASIMADIPTEKNLMFKAALRYFGRAGLSGTVSLSIEKNIPAGGGLGGGSADAASVLRMLNRRYGLMSHDELVLCAASVGADVPFCLTGGTALCRGIGENVERIRGIIGFSVLIVNDGTHVDTAGAYKMIDDERERSGCLSDNVDSLSVIKDSVNNGDYRGLFHSAKNDFEIPVFSRYRSVEGLKKLMSERGSVFSIMTGSGSTVIGLFDNIDLAKRAQERFVIDGVRADLSEFIEP